MLGASAAALSFLVAGTIFGTEEAFFAPIAAVVCVGLTGGHRIHRAAEIVVGVVLGLMSADLLLRVIGSGYWQLGVMVLLATTAAVALGTAQLMANQAAVAAILVVALAPGDANPWVRLGDALIGGGVALLLNSLVAPDPARLVRRAADEVVDELVGTVEDVAAALAAADLAAAEEALERAQGAARRLPDLDEALEAAREGARLARHRRQAFQRLHPFLLLRNRLDLLAVTTRSLARAAANAVRHGRAVDPRLVEAVDGLAAAVGALGRWAQDGQAVEEACTRALEAARCASTVLRGPHGTTAYVLAAHVRTGAVDVLRATGLDQRRAVAALEDVAGRADDLR